MKKQLRSSFSTQGRRMAGARALWAANGMKKNQMGKPIFCQFRHFFGNGIYCNTGYDTCTCMKSGSW